MKARPILFSAPMLRALLAGRKTQTRRIVKPRGHNSLFATEADGSPVWSNSYIMDPGNAEWRMRDNPYGVPGDLLNVRETLRRAPDLWTYAADGSEVGWPARSELAGLKRDTVVSIHMPKGASRLTLEITGLRVERLNDCSETDAIAEGVVPGATYGGRVESWLPSEDDRSVFYPTAREAYAALWKSINGPDSWAANPWVWVVEFTALPLNVNAFLSGDRLDPALRRLIEALAEADAERDYEAAMGRASK